ncbi:hypothetical protein LG296_21165 (plasmid) [Ureibacillus chungkukjangi]|uniref:hypothetical protein n=1 Tax=Ureibacillus chungkukjangi TaxID=1202712 RepID=UPI00187D48AA|nr:hypothetical protein [Ureibacillus chungkukjangi]MCM3390199.1 hypothetical protein [Ureibacillus chungkukjangi]
MHNTSNMMSLIEMIASFRDFLGAADFELIELEDCSKVDDFAESKGNPYDETSNAFKK